MFLILIGSVGEKVRELMRQYNNVNCSILYKNVNCILYIVVRIPQTPEA